MIKPLPDDLRKQIENSEVKNKLLQEEAEKEFAYGDKVEYIKAFGWVEVGSKGTVVFCNTGNKELVVLLDDEKGDNTYQLDSKYVRHIRN
jgi:hypothetical protein